jgi:hypothetical protein
VVDDAVPVAGESHELGEPANAFVLYLGSDRRQRPSAAVRIYGSREQVRQRTDWRCGRGDVSKESRTAIVCGLIEKKLAEFLDYGRDVGTVLGHFASAEFCPHCVGQE